MGRLLRAEKISLNELEHGCEADEGFPHDFYDIFFSKDVTEE